MNKLKDILYGTLAVLSLLVLGFTPVEQAVNYSLTWGTMGVKLVEAGVIDKEKFEELYKNRGGLSPESRALLEQEIAKIALNEENSSEVLNMLWALGLGNKNPVLEKGPMMDPRYGGAGNFASTGGWTLSTGMPMDHYSMHEFIKLTPEQQALVEKVAKNIYRPCCGNATHFPDCNHGMAMLGLMELMASQGRTEEQMYQMALEANTLWFPDHYATIKEFLGQEGKDWGKTDPKEILSAEFSSSKGFQKILSQVELKSSGTGSGCGA